MKNIKVLIPFLLTLPLLLSACGTAASAPETVPEPDGEIVAAMSSQSPTVAQPVVPPEPTNNTVPVAVGAVTLTLPEGWVYEERPEDSQGWTLAFGP